MNKVIAGEHPVEGYRYRNTFANLESCGGLQRMYVP